MPRPRSRPSAPPQLHRLRPQAAPRRHLSAPMPAPRTGVSAPEGGPEPTAAHTGLPAGPAGRAQDGLGGILPFLKGIVLEAFRGAAPRHPGSKTSKRQPRDSGRLRAKGPGREGKRTYLVKDWRVTARGRPRGEVGSAGAASPVRSGLRGEAGVRGPAQAAWSRPALHCGGRPELPEALDEAVR